MITAEDAVLHAADPSVAMWAETNFFAFSAPELDLNGHVYCLFRPNQGVCLTTVAINDRWCKTPWDANYVDLSMHVPMGENFDLRKNGPDALALYLRNIRLALYAKASHIIMEMKK